MGRCRETKATRKRQREKLHIKVTLGIENPADVLTGRLNVTIAQILELTLGSLKL
jgi:hypothetical protein